MGSVSGLVDSHCHLDRLDLAAYDQDFQAMMTATRNAGVGHMLCIGVDLESFPRVREVAEANDDVHCTVGVHPLYREAREPSREELVSLAGHPRVVAIGETGLDYFHARGDTGWQQRRFVTHIEAAAETGLPLVIHTREARRDTLDLLARVGQGRVCGVLHCFTEDQAMADRALDMGLYISISGIVTFASADALRGVVRKLPAERLLIETDSPWLAPVPHRGKPNEPRHVVDVARRVAALKEVSVDEIARVTRENFYRLFTRAAVGRQP